MTDPTTCTVPVEFLRGVIALCTQRGYSPENIEAWSKDDKWVADLWRQAEQMLAIAKWGTPAPVGVEPVAWYEYNADLDAWFLAYSHNTKAKTRPLVFGDTTPQPTQPQAGAVPMTPEQRDALWESCKYDDGEEWTVDWEQIVDAVERHHRIGIKGGQPTQAAEPVAREPLTDEQIGSLACMDGLANIEVPALQWLVREVEYLHGIKGGQHGTKT